MTRGDIRPAHHPGKYLIAHELAHVVQQERGNEVGSATADSILERDADIAAESAASGDMTDVAAGSDTRLSRQTDGEDSPSFSRDGIWGVVKKGPGAFTNAVSNSADAAYQGAKKQVYAALIARLKGMLKSQVSLLRGAVQKLPEEYRSAANSCVDVIAFIGDMWMALILAIVGLVVGFVEGIVGMITGLIKLAIKLMIFLSNIILACFGKPDNLKADLTALDSALRNFLPNVKAAVDAWWKRYQAASLEEQVLMGGELVGQVEALIASFAFAGTQAGKVGSVTAKIPYPVLELAPATADATAVVNVGVKTATATAKLAPPLAAMAMAGTGVASAAGSSGGSGSGSQGRPNRARITSTEKPLPNGRIEIRSTGRVGDAPAARPGLEKKYPTGTKVGLPGSVRFHVEGIKSIGDELNVVYAPERFNISETALIENQIRAWKAEVDAVGGDLAYDFKVKCNVLGQTEGVTVKQLEEITWKLERRLPGSDTYETIFEHTGKP